MVSPSMLILEEYKEQQEHTYEDLLAHMPIQSVTTQSLTRVTAVRVPLAADEARMTVALSLRRKALACGALPSVALPAQQEAFLNSFPLAAPGKILASI
jgi:hypothetical protein